MTYREFINLFFTQLCIENDTIYSWLFNAKLKVKVNQ